MYKYVLCVNIPHYRDYLPMFKIISVMLFRHLLNKKMHKLTVKLFDLLVSYKNALLIEKKITSMDRT